MKQPDATDIARRLAELPEAQQDDPAVRAEVVFTLLCQLNTRRFTADEATEAEARFRDWLAENAPFKAAPSHTQTLFKQTLWWPGLRGNQELDVYLVKYRLSDGQVGVGVAAMDSYAFSQLQVFQLDPFRLLQLYAGWQAAKLATEADDYVCRDNRDDRAKVAGKLEARGFTHIEFDRCLTINHRNYYDGTCRDSTGQPMVWGGSSGYCGGERCDAVIAAIPMVYVILGLELYGEEGLDKPGADQWGCAPGSFLILLAALGVVLAWS